MNAALQQAKTLIHLWCCCDSCSVETWSVAFLCAADVVPSLSVSVSSSPFDTAGCYQLSVAANCFPVCKILLCIYLHVSAPSVSSPVAHI